MSDPRYPSAFQRPGSATPPASERTPTSAPAPATEADAPSRPRASARRSPQTAAPSTGAPVPAKPSPHEPARGGNRIVVLGGSVEDEPSEEPASRRNLAVGGLYALAGVLLALALLGGLWSQGLLRGVDEYGASLNPDGLQEMYFNGEEPGTVGVARLLVQLAPTTLALGVLALLVAIVLPVLTRRPR